MRQDPDTGETLEPVEEVHVEVPDASSGIVIEMLGQRKGQLTNMRQDGNGTVYYTYLVPTRGMLGFRQAFLTATRGTGVVHSLFYGYELYAGAIRGRSNGSLVAWEPGTATAYAMFNAQERGQLFINPGVEVYEGMIIGRCCARRGHRNQRRQEEAPDQPPLFQRRRAGAPGSAAADVAGRCN